MIGFAGMTHLGLVSAAAAAAKGFDVAAYDPDAARCDALTRGQLPVVEPGLAELLDTVRPRVRFTTDLAALGGCELIYIAVDVPTDESGRSDLSPVSRLLCQVAEVAAPATVVVVLSQVPPGFTRRARQELADAGVAVNLLYQVETLVFGRAVERALAPERFMVGTPDTTRPLPPALGRFLSAFDCPVLLFLVASVSTTNMLAEMCEVVGAEWREISPALRLDRRIGQHAYLAPGLGIGGGNLPRDMATVVALAAEHGVDAGLIGAWSSHSTFRREWVLRVLHRTVLSAVTESRIAVWGLAYKEHTQFTRNSPAVHLIGHLRNIRVHAYDPEADFDSTAFPHVTRTTCALDACRDADALAVMTPWPEFGTVDLTACAATMRGRVLVDPFGVIHRINAEAAGFLHFRLGSGAPQTAGQPC
jgi:UDPglucose 6-dehydrogenase